MTARLAAAGIFLAAFLLYSRSAAPGLSFEDSGEITASALTLGVPQSPGHVWPDLVGRLALAFPAGNPAFRLSVVSAACAAAAVLAAWVFAGSLAGASAAFVLAVCPLLWWEAGIAEKHAMAAALGAWTALALRRSLEEGGDRWLLLAFVLFGLLAGVHPAGLILAPVLGWGWWRRRRARAAWLAVCVGVLAAAPVLLYPAIRAHARPELLWGEPDRIGGWLGYVFAAGSLRANLFRDASFGGLASGLLQHAVVMPWRQAGLLAAAALLGGWAAWHRDRRTLILLGGIFVAGALAGAAFQSPLADRWDLPACFAVAVLAGIGVAWTAQVSRWGPVACLAVWAWGVAGNAPSVMHDRDTSASDCVRNVLAFAKPGDLVIASGDAWVHPLRYARIVDRTPEAARFESADVLEYGSAGRKRLASSGDGRLRPLSGGATGPALLWQLRRSAGSTRVWLAPEEPPALIPSRGTSWAGISIRVIDPTERTGLDGAGGRWMRGLRLRGLTRPRGIHEAVVARNVTYSLNTRAQLLLRAGLARDAEAAARAGLRLEPGLPELRQTLGRALMEQGKVQEAASEWQAAISLTRERYLDPYLGLSGIARRRKTATAEDEELELLRIAAVLGAPGGDSASPPVAAGDEARSRGDWAGARAAYRRAVAAGLVARGLLHFQAGRLPQAGAAWEEALVFDPRSPQALEDLGTLAALEERFADALDWFRAAERAGGRSAGLDLNIAQTGEALRWAPRVDGLEAVAARRAGDADAQIAAGNAEWYVGRTPAAESAYRRAVRADPANVRALTNLGSALVQEGRPREAIPVYERALRANPKYAGAMANLATVYLQLGDRTRARRWMEKTLELDPAEARALQMKRELGW